MICRWAHLLPRLCVCLAGAATSGAIASRKNLICLKRQGAMYHTVPRRAGPGGPGLPDSDSDRVILRAHGSGPCWRARDARASLSFPPAFASLRGEPRRGHSLAPFPCTRTPFKYAFARTTSRATTIPAPWVAISLLPVPRGPAPALAPVLAMTPRLPSRTSTA